MGGGGGLFRDHSPEDLRSEIKKSIEKTKNNALETEVNLKINEILAEYNDRDIETIQDHLEEIKKVIESDITGTIDLKFGGSISKNTYIEGLSDVDTLITIDKSELSSLSPKKVLEYLKSRLETNLSNFENIKVGTLAVTVTFSDKTEVQILPAIKHYSGFKIPKANGNGWSDIIHPKKFAEKLTEINKNHNNNVVPVIKLAKGIIAQLPPDQQLKGYHIESIAIEAFKRYPKNNSQTKKTLIKYFFEKAKDIVKSKIKDSTGQLINVDSYLGSENSKKRKETSYVLNRIYQKMENADRIGSATEWSKILGE